MDATEQPIRRPKTNQRAHYSGQKKRHTIKHQIVVVRKKKAPGQKQTVRIAAVSGAANGKTHDKKVYDRFGTRVPPGVPKAGDSAARGTDLAVPHTKPRGGRLTAPQKQHNRELSRRRIAAEHGIGKMKIWRITADRYQKQFQT
ncbi:transposase family protein [Fimbriiglobus ruber]|uniref:Putative transposase for insertion sequence element IS702 n=1 Tax=Fimbriiglobus ruber TaxID=1908690 RepID=A0A225D299_9BACT|nr:putative transposase for insertion sequence element IS702 [Fimbriiglobus ruber]